MLIFSIGMGVTFGVQKHFHAHQKSQLDRPALVRNLVVEISGIFLTLPKFAVKPLTSDMGI